MKPEIPLPYHEPSNVTDVLERTHKVLSGNVSHGNLNPKDVGRNMDEYPATATTPGVADTQFTINHGLNRVPVGFYLINKSGAVDVYDSGTAWTKSQIFLKATTINIAIKLLIF